MDELIYLLIKAIVRAFQNSGTNANRERDQQAVRSWQQQAWEQQRAAAARAMQSAPPPKPPLARPAGPVVAKRARAATAPALEVAAPALRSFAGSTTSVRVAGLTEPATLRRRFILTEILRPPVSLREPPF